MPYDIKTSFIASQITSITGTTANFSSTTASTSNTTGSLTTSGGLGISNTTDSTSSTNGGTITTAGGLAVAKKAYIGTDLFVTGNVGIGTTSIANKVVVSGGISQLQNINAPASQLYVQNSNSGINAYSILTVASDTANLNLIVNSSTRTSADSGASAATIRNDNGTLTLGWAGYNTIFPGNVVMNNTTTSTSNTTGVITLAGGLGISNTVDATSSTNGGTITTAGGLAVAKKAFIGTDFAVGGTTNLANLTSSTALALDSSKNIVSVANTGTGNNVLQANPTITGTLNTSAISATNGNFSTTLGVTGLITANGGVFIPSSSNDQGSTFFLRNSNTGTSAYSQFSIGNDSVSTFNILLNSSTRTAEGGINTATIRNDAGILRLQSNSGTGVIINTSGDVVISSTTASSSNSTGGLILSGGLGISNTTDATSSTNGGSITTSGGLAVAKKVYIGTDLVVGGTTNLANLTSSTALALDSSKNILSVTNTGTGNNVLQANPTITGTLTTSAISATSGNFSTTLGVTGLATFGAGGLTSTSGTTTLGTSTIGTITGTSASFSSVLGVTGLITANGGVFIPSSSNDQGSTFFLRNSNAGSLAYSQFSIGNDSVSTFNILLNSSTRTAEGGINAATIRNDAGILRLQSNSGTGVIINTSGDVVISSTTASSSNSTGGLILSGGLGISNNTDAISSTNGGSITTAGGLAVAKKAYIGTDLVVGGTTNLANLTSSTALALDSSKNILSVANTGTGNNVLQANPTITGTLTTSAISATSGNFSTTLGVTGLATFGAGGLTSTAGTTTLGTSTIGAITGTSASFSSVLGVTGLITSNGGIFIPSSSNDQGSTFFVRNSNAGSLAYSQFSIGNNTGSSFNILLNSSNNTSEGGINAATIRNDAGILRLQSNSGTGVIINTSGNVVIGSTTASSSNSTGGLILSGGLGISNTTDATSSTNGGSITTAGGLAVAKKAYFGSDLIAGSIQSVSASTISTQGAYLQWNRTGIDGETWLINTNVGSNPGIRFGKSTLADSVTELMRIGDNGNVGIGNTSPNAPLHFSNNTANRKIVLFEGTNNDHQFYGLGVNTAILRYQTDSTGADHVFYAATGSTSSNELMRIKGNGSITATKKMQCGSTDGGGNSTGTVTFPDVFNSIPFVTLTVVNGDTSNVYVAELTSTSTTSFSFIKRYQNISGGGWDNAINESINWIAISI
jgi:hypothetical protein